MQEAVQIKIKQKQKIKQFEENLNR